MNARIFILPILLLAACDETGDSASDSAPSAGADTGLSAKLTPAYLKGDWCYSHNVISEERSDEGMTYAFSDDGTLLYQTNPNTAVENPGSYTIDNGHLKILPTLRFFDFTAESIDPDGMVLRMAYGLAVWKRGSCGM
jgi:hypothetical protein